MLLRDRAPYQNRKPLTKIARLNVKGPANATVRLMNDQFDQYRDILRLIWNFALRHRATGTVSLDDVSTVLLGALVLDDLEKVTPEKARRTVLQGQTGQHLSECYIPALGIIISSRSSTIYRAEDHNGSNSWYAVDPSPPPGTLLYYIDIYDFKSDDQAMEFEYVKALTPASIHGLEAGSVLVVRRSDVDIVDLTS
jgi:hypothetical protein